MQKLPSVVKDKLNRDLHRVKNHPIAITKQLVYEYFDSLGRNFDKYEDCPKAVSVSDNFDRLLIPPDHPARSSSDTFYVTEETVLRTHTTAHQYQILESGHTDFLVTGDVYRRDSVDKTHYPVFHQIEGVSQARSQQPVKELEDILRGLANHLFPGKQVKISPDYFPFTNPSLEVEVEFGSDWLEILGGGIVHSRILQDLEIVTPLLAWGIGLERLAMILFDIPDIRLFWTSDDKFLSQFSDGKVTKYQPYSNIEPIERDISFWIPEKRVAKASATEFSWKDENVFCEYVREAGGDLVEAIVLYDKFYHSKQQKYSHTFRVKFSPVVSWHDGAHLVKVANETMSSLRDLIAEKFDVILR